MQRSSKMLDKANRVEKQMRVLHRQALPLTYLLALMAKAVSLLLLLLLSVTESLEKSQD